MSCLTGDKKMTHLPIPPRVLISTFAVLSCVLYSIISRTLVLLSDETEMYLDLFYSDSLVRDEIPVGEQSPITHTHYFLLVLPVGNTSLLTANLEQRALFSRSGWTCRLTMAGGSPPLISIHSLAISSVTRGRRGLRTFVPMSSCPLHLDLLDVSAVEVDSPA